MLEHSASTPFNEESMYGLLYKDALARSTCSEGIDSKERSEMDSFHWQSEVDLREHVA